MSKGCKEGNDLVRPPLLLFCVAIAARALFEDVTTFVSYQACA